MVIKHVIVSLCFHATHTPQCLQSLRNAHLISGFVGAPPHTSLVANQQLLFLNSPFSVIDSLVGLRADGLLHRLGVL